MGDVWIQNTPLITVVGFRFCQYCFGGIRWPSSFAGPAYFPGTIQRTDICPSHRIHIRHTGCPSTGSSGGFLTHHTPEPAMQLLVHAMFDYGDREADGFGDPIQAER